MHKKTALLFMIPFLLLNTPAFSKTEAQEVTFQGEKFQYFTDGKCPIPAQELKIIKNKIQEHVSEAYYYQHFDLDTVHARDSAGGCGYGSWHWVLVEARYKLTIDDQSFPYKVSLEWDEHNDRWKFTDFNIPREVTSIISSDAIEPKIRECTYEQVDYSVEPVIRKGFTLLYQGHGNVYGYGGNRTYYFSLNAENGVLEFCTGGNYILITNSTTHIALPMGCLSSDCLFSTNYTLSAAYIDMQNRSLSFELPKFDSNTTLTIQISRRLIDAKSNDQDGVFTVMLDGERYQYKEIEKTETHRTLMISSIPEGTKRLDIIGTHIIQSGLSPSIAFDKQVYRISELMTITVVDPAMNRDSSAIDVVELRMRSSSVPKGGGYYSLWPIRETGNSTGIFKETALFVKSDAECDCGLRVFVKPGDLLYANYKYLTATARIFDPSSVVIQPEITLNKKEYTPFDKVFVTITSPYNNQNPDKIDTINLLVSSSSDILGIQKFPETAPNTGMFEREFKLTPNKELFPGDLKTIRGDAITFEFSFDEDTVVTETAFVNYHVAIAEFERDSFRSSERGFLRVIDPDANRNPDAMDTTELRFWSSTDRGGLLVVLRERGDNTGIFEEIVTFRVRECTGIRLCMSEGDTVTAEYTDITLPAPAKLIVEGAFKGVFTTEIKKLFATTLIGPGVASLSQAVASEPELVDQIGAPLTDVSIGSQILIQSEITNSQPRKQPFAYIVQIRDGNGVTVSLSWVSGELPARKSLTAAQSWIPDTRGDFVVEIFVWESMEKPVALSPIRTRAISLN